MEEILVVTSKVKKYIKEKGEMNCSATVIEKLSKMVQDECDRAVENAKKDKRKTVMDRDFCAS
jgi:histone H3/H4